LAYWLVVAAVVAVAVVIVAVVVEVASLSWK